VPNEHSQTKRLEIHKCSNCGLIFVGTKLDDAELGEAYASLDTNAYYAETTHELNRKMARSVADLQQLVSKESSILDIGTGDGTFLKMLLESGFCQVSGHEIPGSTVKKVDPSSCKMYYDFDYSHIPDNSFDVVTLLDVAEHVLDIQHLFNACYRVLKPDGFIYIHTPCVSRMDTIMHSFLGLRGLPSKIAHVWQRSRTSIFHLQNYTPESSRILLQQKGLLEISLRTENELSWPVTRYVKVYVCQKQGLPTFLAPFIAVLLYPFVATSLFNANKIILSAKKPKDLSVAVVQ
jgi:ubiquinone/menaquinone biosynthesis C-methylase UbiE